MTELPTYSYTLAKWPNYQMSKIAAIFQRRWRDNVMMVNAYCLKRGSGKGTTLSYPIPPVDGG